MLVGCELRSQSLLCAVEGERQAALQAVILQISVSCESLLLGCFHLFLPVTT